jgi:hypothetical protein
VGIDSREFILNKKLLSTVSEYFAGRLDASGVNFVQRNAQLNALWLEDFDPEMFELFAYWLGEQAHHETLCSVSFRPFLDEAEAQDCCEELHWDLINLHLFAARIELDSLQDAAMDAIQDLYLRCDWDVTPRLVSHIYTECEPEYSYRLRKWTVAMAAWSMGETTDATDTSLQELFAACPVFRDDYVAHLAKSSRNRIRLQFKNPQLRLPTNSLRNDERQFGYRQCSFHTHRSSVGQGRCPHDSAALPVLALSKPLPQEPLSDEDSDLELLSPGGAALSSAGGLCALEANMPLTPLSPAAHSAIINMYLDIR